MIDLLALEGLGVDGGHEGIERLVEEAVAPDHALDDGARGLAGAETGDLQGGNEALIGGIEGPLKAVRFDFDL